MFRLREEPPPSSFFAFSTLSSLHLPFFPFFLSFSYDATSTRREELVAGVLRARARTYTLDICLERETEKKNIENGTRFLRQ